MRQHHEQVYHLVCFHKIDSIILYICALCAHFDPRNGSACYRVLRVVQRRLMLTIAIKEGYLLAFALARH